jgi:hypothetical protein
MTVKKKETKFVHKKEPNKFVKKKKSKFVHKKESSS